MWIFVAFEFCGDTCIFRNIFFKYIILMIFLASFFFEIFALFSFFSFFWGGQKKLWLWFEEYYFVLLKT